MAVSDILTDVRSILADPNGDRWNDTRLIKILDQAQKDLCRKTMCLVTSEDVVVSTGQSTYTLPEQLQNTTRILYNDTLLQLVSHAELDAKSTTWETVTGTPEYAILDKLSRGLVKLYPIPDFTPDNPFDITTANTLTIYYTKIPDTLDALTDILETEDIYDTILGRYVVGTALRDDVDPQNRAMGNEELNMYASELQIIKDEVAKDYVGSTIHYTSDYRRL